MNTLRFNRHLTTLILALGIGCIAQATAVGPTARVMPDGIKTPTQHTAYTWAGNPLDVWGNVAWGTAGGGSYEWNFGDGSPPASGTITDPRNISEIHTYVAAGTFYATLTVTDDDSLSATAQVRVEVLPVPDAAAQVNLAVERGLKRLYLIQDPGGWWPGSADASTALSVLALENRGHRPISPDTDIYKASVVAGLNYLFRILYWQTDIPYPGAPFDYNPDVNGNGGVVAYWGNGDYVHGMIMSAIVAAGSYDPGFPKTDATHNPALNLIVPALGSSVDGLTYYAVLDDMVEACAWAQADPGGGGYWDYVLIDPCGWMDWVFDWDCACELCDCSEDCPDCWYEVCVEYWDYVWFPDDCYARGGWRYSPNQCDADNSIAQWFGIGLEEAELWGCYAPAWLKSELKDYWLLNSWNSTLAGWGYSGNSDFITAAHSGAGLCMMAYVGIPKTDTWAVQAWDSLGVHWNDNHSFDGGAGWGDWETHFGPGTPNYYAMYAIAKAARIARDGLGIVSEVTTVGGHDWYSDYSNYLLPLQLSHGGWPGYFYWGEDVATPFAILILEKNVGSLRPQAALSASPNPVNAGTTVNFDCGGSVHQDPTKFLVSWKMDFDTSDGVDWSSPDAADNFPNSVASKSGGYPQKDPPEDYDVTALVQVTDDAGDTAEAVVVVHIVTGLVPPVANPNGPYFGRLSDPVVLDGSASYDPNPGGSITQYEWDLDGNGSYETDGGAASTLSHTWNTPYSGLIGLKVTDNFGMSSTASAYTRIIVCDLRPVSYPLVSYRRISRSVWEYEFNFVARNVGSDSASEATATLNNWPAHVQVVEGTVGFPGIIAGGGDPVSSSDTFTIRIDRSKPVASQDLTWLIRYRDPAGTTWTLVNFPLF